ncbi:MAG: hypothetical protein MOB07_13090 [Acidobacteria bacterium]|nr:hypothetical protein [Acidobacteriota bacterium]
MEEGVQRESKDENAGGQAIRESKDSGERGTTFERGSKDGNAGERLARIREGERRGSDNEKTEEQSNDGSQNPGEQDSTFVWGSRAGETGEQAAQVISLLTIHPCGELTNEQAPQWLKAVLPVATNGWWDVYPKDKGFAVKFCWRDQGRQTVTFPRISYDQFQTMKRSASGEVEETLRSQITNHLHSLLFNPAKRDKALVAAEKLGIDLDVHAVHNLIDKEM